MASKNVRTRDFKKLFDALPERIRRLAITAFNTFCQNPDHPALRRHQLDDNKRGQHKENSISVSINMQYRAVYVEDGDTNVWYWVGNHNDYETFVGEK